MSSKRNRDTNSQMSSVLRECHKVALSAVRSASRLTRKCSPTSQQATKSDKSPVTVADYGSQALICKTLLSSSPKYAIIGEEDTTDLKTQNDLLTTVFNLVQEQTEDTISSEDVLFYIQSGSQRAADGAFWTLDPIDGTKGFLRGEQYAIALALVDQGIPQVAALACPNLCMKEQTGWVLSAIKGEGCWVAPLDSDDLGTLVRMSGTPATPQIRFVESVESAHSAHDVTAELKQDLGIVAPPVRMDSQAKYAAVALGLADLYLRIPTNLAKPRPESIWDHAAGALIVHEAGGTVVDTSGKQIDWTTGWQLTNNTGIVASTKGIEEVVIEKLVQVLNKRRAAL